jgi:hypothetical protein
MSSADTGNNIIRDNARMRGHSTNRYKTLRSMYLGSTNDSNEKYITHLTPTQLAEGRKRAKAYYTKRNMRIYTQIFVTFTLACLIVWFALWYLLT